MKIILIAITVVVFLFSAITASLSDAFWNNVPMIITAVTAFTIAFGGIVIKFWTFLRGIKKNVEKVHTLVNSNYGYSLKQNAGNARRVADLTKSPMDALVAIEAEKLLADHEEQQAIVDAGEKN